MIDPSSDNISLSQQHSPLSIEKNDPKVIHVQKSTGVQKTCVYCSIIFAQKNAAAKKSNMGQRGEAQHYYLQRLLGGKNLYPPLS